MKKIERVLNIIGKKQTKILFGALSILLIVGTIFLLTKDTNKDKKDSPIKKIDTNITDSLTENTATNDTTDDIETTDDIVNIQNEESTKKEAVSTEKAKTKTKAKSSDHEHHWSPVYVDHPRQYQDGYWRFPEGTIETAYYAFGNTDHVIYPEDMLSKDVVHIYALHSDTNWWTSKSDVVITGYKEVKHAYFETGEIIPVQFLTDNYITWHARRYGPGKYTFGYETMPIRKEVEKYFVETVPEIAAWREITHEVCYCGETRKYES